MTVGTGIFENDTNENNYIGGAAGDNRAMARILDMRDLASRTVVIPVFLINPLIRGAGDGKD